MHAWVKGAARNVCDPSRWLNASIFVFLQLHTHSSNGVTATGNSKPIGAVLVLDLTNMPGSLPLQSLLIPVFPPNGRHKRSIVFAAGQTGV